MEGGAIAGDKITLRVSQLNYLLSCRLCNGYFREALTIPECLHTFCRSCLLLYLINTPSQKCPTCATDLGPHPTAALVIDRVLQNLVDKLHPHLAEEDLRAEEEFYAQHNIPLREEVQEKADDVVLTEGVMDYAKVALREGTPASGFVQERWILLAPELEVTPENLRMKPLEKPFVRGLGRIRVSQLCKYLALKFPNAGGPDNIEILCSGSPCGKELSLHFIYCTRWRSIKTENMVLHYKMKQLPTQL